jgi:hypothetical protein
MENGTSQRAAVLRVLEGLGEGATMCAGMVARRVATTLRELRGLLVEMQRDGEIEVFQRGASVDLRTARGPIRVSARRSSR